MSIASAKRFLEDQGYVVVLRAEPGWEERAFRLNEEYIAVKLVDGQCGLIRPIELCNVIGIERHTLSRALKRPECPRVRQERGPKHRLVRIQVTPEFIRYLRRNKRSS
jgi:hypothetical protein